MPKKLKGPFGILQHPFCRKTPIKEKEDPLGIISFKKMSHNAETNSNVGPFGLARYCMLRGKKEKPFRFCSPGQMVQFDTMKFRRTY